MKTIAVALGEIFAEWPELYGFSIGELDGVLSLEDVAVDPWGARNEALPREIAAALLELIDEQPEAAALLRGRTFARTLH